MKNFFYFISTVILISSTGLYAESELQIAIKKKNVKYFQTVKFSKFEKDNMGAKFTAIGELCTNDNVLSDNCVACLLAGLENKDLKSREAMSSELTGMVYNLKSNANLKKVVLDKVKKNRDASEVIKGNLKYIIEQLEAK